MKRTLAFLAPLALSGCRDGVIHAWRIFAAHVAGFVIIGLVLVFTLPRIERRREQRRPFREPPDIEDDVPL